MCFENESAFNDSEQRFLNILGEHPGRTEVWVQLREERKIKRMGNRFKVLAGSKILERLGNEWGEKNVLVREKKQ